MMNIVFALVALGQLLSSEGFFFGSSKVCYGDLGCFSDDGFSNTLGELPDSPDKINVSVTLFTRLSPTHGHLLNYEDTLSVETSNFDARKDTKFIIHGYMSMGYAPWVINMTNYLLLEGDFNVIVVNWEAGAHHDFYPKSAANTRVTGAIVAKLIELLCDNFQLNLTSVHLIGHSLGAHVAGFVGRRLPGVSRISGLDPAGPLFEDANTEARLDPSDAKYVDNIHTDAVPIYDAGFGTSQAWGHIDFYPNGGKIQPGCPSPVSSGLEDILTFDFHDAIPAVSCSHRRSYHYFTESLANKHCQFTAYPCSSYDNFKTGRCNTCGDAPCPTLGYNSYKADRLGRFYLTTNSQSPFCENNRT